MKLRMAENSLFAILLRSRWWISALIAAALAAVMGALLPRDLAPWGMAASLPFLVVAALALRAQWGRPGARQVAAVRERVAAQTWRDFSGALEQAWTAQGVVVTRPEGAAAGAADFVLRKGGVRTLVSARRWKAAGIGIEPLRELQAAQAGSGATDCALVALGALTPQALRYAKEQGIRVLGADELAVLLGRG